MEFCLNFDGILQLQIQIFQKIYTKPYKIILPTAFKYQKRNLHCSLTQKKLLRKKWQDVESCMYHFDTGSIFLGLSFSVTHHVF